MSATTAGWLILLCPLVGTVVIALPLALSARLALTPRAAPLVVTSGICEVLGFYSYTAGARHGTGSRSAQSTLNVA